MRRSAIALGRSVASIARHGRVSLTTAAPLRPAAGPALWRSMATAVPEVEPLLVPTREVGPSATPLLFTPGPLTTSLTVKQEMLVDLGSRDSRFMSVIRDVRSKLLEIANVSQEKGFESIIVQGSGTFAVESTLTSVVPREGAKVLVANNGPYCARMVQILGHAGVPCSEVKFGEREVPTPDAVVAALKADPSLTHVSMVHHETSAGALTDVGAIARAINAFNPEITVIVDSMSAFGVEPVDLINDHIHYLVSSPNKCLEGVPGFAFCIANRERLIASEGSARSLSLDLQAQWRALEAAGTFRFTPPTHTMLAFRQAMREYEAEGGLPGRRARYKRNFDTLVDGMAKLGFHPYLDKEVRGIIISAFMYPEDKNFDFWKLYARLGEVGYVLYPGKQTNVDTFRIGSIGRLFPSDVEALLVIIEHELRQMGVSLPVTQVALPADA